MKQKQHSHTQTHAKHMMQIENHTESGASEKKQHKMRMLASKQEKDAKKNKVDTTTTKKKENKQVLIEGQNKTKHKEKDNVEKGNH